MRRLGLLLFAAIALLSGAGSASATPVPIQDLGQVSTGTSFHDAFSTFTSYADKFAFEVTSSGALTINIALFGKLDFTMTLTKPFGGGVVETTTGDASVYLQTWNNPKDFGPLSFSYALLEAGTYYLTITGDACHCSGYNGSLAFAANTPIPAALVMFLTAIGGLGLVGWKRSGSPAKALAAQAA